MANLNVMILVKKMNGMDYGLKKMDEMDYDPKKVRWNMTTEVSKCNMGRGEVEWLSRDVMQTNNRTPIYTLFI